MGEYGTIHRPEEFEVCAGGCFGPTFTVRLKDGRLAYENSPGMYSLASMVEIEPDTNAWAQFWDELETIGVWYWKPLYEEGAEEGVHWFVHIVAGDRRVTSEGENAFPGEDRSGTTNEFERFMTALSRLLGNIKLW